MFRFLLDEKAEVAMAVLPFLLKPGAKEGLSQQQDFVHFIPVSKLPSIVLAQGFKWLSKS